MAEMGLDDLAIAVVVPCLDEAATIATVVADFRAALPTARIYVYDNASTDRTAARANDAGAVVRREPLRGKGNVVRRMFADVDVLVLVDGDGTYPAAAAREMIAALLDGPVDMVRGVRAPVHAAAFRRGHRLGNALITRVVGLLFGVSFRDVLTGYRVLSRRFAKSFPALSSGFEVETEMTVHALQTRLPTAEVEVPYLPRTDGSASKLRTLKDGIAILRNHLRPREGRKTPRALHHRRRPARSAGGRACVAASRGVSRDRTRGTASNRRAVHGPGRPKGRVVLDGHQPPRRQNHRRPIRAEPRVPGLPRRPAPGVRPDHRIGDHPEHVADARRCTPQVVGRVVRVDDDRIREAPQKTFHDRAATSPGAGELKPVVARPAHDEPEPVPGVQPGQQRGQLARGRVARIACGRTRST